MLISIIARIESARSREFIVACSMQGLEIYPHEVDMMAEELLLLSTRAIAISTGLPQCRDAGVDTVGSPILSEGAACCGKIDSRSGRSTSRSTRA